MYQKLTLLIEDSDLRKQLGKMVKKEQKINFQHVILDQYEELYEELNSIRIKKYEKYKFRKIITKQSIRPFYVVF